jgi:hypothetical protein
MLRRYFKRITLLLFILIISSIGPINIVFANGTAGTVIPVPYTGEVAEINVGTQQGDAINVENLPWTQVGDDVVLAFKISGSAEQAETFLLPMLSMNSPFYQNTETIFVDDNGESQHLNYASVPETEDESNEWFLNYEVFKPLLRGETYYISIKYKTVDQVKNQTEYQKMQFTKFSESSTQFAGGGGTGVPVAPGATGDGTVSNPFFINGDTEINYDDQPFYFMVANGGKEGTYIVNADYEKKLVTFKYVDDKRLVGYYKEHTGDPDYSQFGTETIELTSKPLEQTYNITTIGGVWGKEFKLANGYRGASILGDVPYPSAYVFVQETMMENARYCFKAPEVVMDEKAGFIEETLTRLLLALGSVFLLILQLIIGKKVTIDKIIFNDNDFKQTILDFFGGSKGTISNEIAIGINYWFKVFQYLALFFYLIILVYVGMKVILASTGAQKGKYKEAINSWLAGLLLLFFLPYGLKYIVVINNNLVEKLGENRQSIYTYYNAADIKKMEMDGKYAGGDAFTSDIDELKQLEQDLEGKEAELKKQEDEIHAKMPEKVQPVWAQVSISVPEDVYVEAYYKYIYIIYTFIPENINDWTTEVEKQYQKEIDEMYEMLKNGGYTATSRDEWENYLKDIKAKNMEIAEVQEQLEYVQMLIQIKTSSTDLMGQMYLKAGETGRIFYALVWLILIWQLVFLLILYYKRIFMVALLIVIFPLVMVTYVLDKLKDGKSQVFNTWFNEYLINIIVQFFHAVAYLVLVDTGLKIYQKNPNNWLFFLLAIMSLFPIERILRSIFGLNASTLYSIKDTISHGAFVGTTAVVVGVSTVRSVKNGINSIKNWRENRKNKSTEAQSQSAGDDIVTDQNNNGERARPGEGVASTIKDTVKRSADTGKKVRRIVKKIGSGVGKVSGTILGAAAGLAGSDGFEDVVSHTRAGIMTGKTLGETVASPVAYTINKGMVTAGNRAIKRGSLDSELGIDSGYSEENRQRIRNAVARGRSKARTAGEQIGEASAWGGDKNIGKINLNKRNTMPNLNDTLDITEEDE